MAVHLKEVPVVRRSSSMIRRNVSVRLKERLSVHRRIALGTWAPPDDPTVHGTLRLRAEPVLDWVTRARAATGQRITLTSVVAKAMGIVLQEVPDANVLIRWGRIYLRQDIDIFVHVAFKDPVTGKHDLSGVTLRGVDSRTVSELAAELEASVSRVRQDDDPSMKATRRRMRQLPQVLMRRMLKSLSFASYTLNLDLSGIGSPRDPFGGVAITNVGALGLDTAYVPLVPYTRLPIFLAMGAVCDEPVVENGEVVPAKVLALHASFDHRILDGAQVARMANILRRVFANPDGELGPADPSA